MPSSLNAFLLFGLTCSIVTVVASFRQCYQAETVIVNDENEVSNDKGIFPADNYTTVQCNSTDAFCFKQRFMEINDKHFPNFTEVIHYRWGCSENEKPLKGYIKCGDVFAESYDYTTHEPDFGIYQNFVIDHICSCCGDFCNNSTMDDQCNSDGHTDKNCYASHNPSDDPHVDILMTTMPCSPKQSCYVNSSLIKLFNHLKTFFIL